MLLIDVNVLVYAHRQESLRHAEYRGWLESVVNAADPFGMSEHVLAGFLRVVTHPRVFNPPTPLATAMKFVQEINGHPNRVRVAPGNRHWQIFRDLCKTAGATGNLVPDAWLAALAIESNSEWITTDRDYSRFPGLRWRHPLDG